MDQRHGRCSGLDPGAQLAIGLPPGVTRFERERLLFLSLGPPGGLLPELQPGLESAPKRPFGLFENHSRNK